MATYIQGQADYISQIQPTEPNLAFDAQILQTKQTKYDANQKKVNELYGSLLNSAMTRTDNIQARDEFFQIINDDIKRMGGLDFSLDQNVQAAASVFQSIYTNNNIVKDMVWTKNYNNETSRMESFKNCLDEEKCGGSYWDEGDKYMQYKRMEFKNASAGDALGMGDVKFVPYRSVMKDALKMAKEAGLSVEFDKLSADGSYMITTKNGEMLRSPLTALFNKTLGQNPQLVEMFKTKAYVDRNDWAYSKVNMGEYNDLNEAQLGYIKEIDRQNKTKLQIQAEALDADIEHLDAKTKEMEDEYYEGGFKKGSDKYNQLVQLKELQQSAINAKSYTDQISSITANNQAALSTMLDHIDNQNSYALFNDEIQGAVNTLLFKDAKSTMKADDFAKMRVEHGYKLSEMAVKHKYDNEDEALEQQNKIAFEEYKKSIGHSSYTGEKGKDMLGKSNTYIEKKNEAESFNLEAEAAKIMAKDTGGEIPTLEDIKTYKPNEVGGKYEAYVAALKKAMDLRDEKQREANKAAVAFGKTPIYNDMITATDLSTYNNNFDYDFQEDWLLKNYNQMAPVYLKEHGKELTKERFQYAIKKADEAKPLLSEIKNNLQIK
jgi:hypothetical protein